jgi:nucleoside-diphosphate-sugar epimerase
MNILITGGAGYIGSSLIAQLTDIAEVAVFDNLLYDQGTLVGKPLTHKRVKFYREDINDWSDNLINELDKADIIIPLAALVGAPLCEQNKELAIETNYRWFNKLLNYLNNQVVMYPNTNSGYGSTGEEICTEETPSKPISLYAQTKQNSEDILINSYDKAICFRLATVFGWSYRPRTDLLINNLVKIAKDDGEIKIFDGQFRRNYIHIKDIVAAFLFIINYDEPDEVYGNVYNLGNDKLNMTKMQLVYNICHLLKATYSIDTSQTDPDKRDYIVSSQKLYNLGYRCRIGLEEGVREMSSFYNLLSQDDIDKCKNY